MTFVLFDNCRHLFAIGNEVFTHLLQDAEDQCILVRYDYIHST